jgi:hypothetical protein
MDKWKMGVGWLRWIRGFGIGNYWEIRNLGGNGVKSTYKVDALLFIGYK